MSRAAEILKTAATGRIRPYAVGPEWGALSTVLTRFSSRYSGNVLVRVFPQAPPSGAPGEIHLKTGLIYLDGALLDGRLADWGASLSAGQARSVMVLLGVDLHEVGHHRHTQPEKYAAQCAQPDTPTGPEAQLIADMGWLEEPRMEARVNQSIAIAPPFLRAQSAVLDLRDLQPLMSPRAAAANMVMIVGRRWAGSLTEADSTLMRQIARGWCGARVHDALDDLLRRVAAIADDEWAGLADAAREYRAILDALPAEPAGGGGRPAPGAAGGQAGGGQAGGGGEPTGGGGGAPGDPDAQLQALKDALQATAHDAAEQIAVDAQALGAVQQVAAETQAVQHGAGFVGGPGGLLAGLASGRPLPPPGERDPLAIETLARRQLARELRKAKSQRTAREGRVKPPGRFNPRGALKQHYERDRRLPPRARPFRARVTLDKELWAPRVLLLVDTSGSMGAHRAALGSVTWVCHGAVRDLAGDMAVLLFGDAVAALIGAGRDLARVPELRSGGGTDFVGRALELGMAELDMFDVRAPRLVFILTDGYWADPHGHRVMSDLRAAGARIVMIGVGSPPAEHPHVDESVVVSDPLHIADVLGTAVVRALRDIDF